MNIIRRLNVVLVLVAITGGAATAQTVRLNQVMRTKLQHSQRILEAVVTSNWTLLDTESKALARSPRIRRGRSCSSRSTSVRAGPSCVRPTT